ncbi:MAG TPA: AAA-like domain-containing protein [Leptolyngbyaceae cyanobacterium]
MKQRTDLANHPCQSMNIDEIVEAVEKTILYRPLNPLERLILRQSWLGQDYKEMTQNARYGSNYIKEVGSQLWRELSDALGQKVTKKNIHIILSHHELNRTNNPENQEEQALTSELRPKSNYPVLHEFHKIKYPSEPVPFNSPLYVSRPPVEELAYREINKSGCVIRIKAPKKMGKSSLLNQIIAHSSEKGYKIVYLDFQEAEQAVFASLDKFLRWFCANVSRSLNLSSKLEEYWDEDMGSKVSCKIYFEGYLLEEIDRPIVLALNEVNRVFEHPTIAQDFLPMLRFWHEQGQSVEAWQKLRLVVVHSTEIYIPLKINQSPFNVGLSIQLPPFNLEQVKDLGRRYGLNWTNSNEAQKLMEIVGGHPYLVSIALYHLCQGEITLDELLRTAPTQAGIYRDYLRSHLAMLRDEPALTSAFQQVVSQDGSVPLEAIAAYKLESMGLIQLEGNLAKLSCELYRLYFREQLGFGQALGGILFS